MATFETAGLDELIRDMRRMGQDAGEIADAMVNQAVVEIRDAWRETAEKHHYHASGDMIKSIGFPKPIGNIGAIKYRDVYPVGKDGKGVRNAEKAFYLHYGTHRVKASYWVDEALAAAEPRAYDKLQKMWDSFLETGKVPEVEDNAAFAKTTK